MDTSLPDVNQYYNNPELQGLQQNAAGAANTAGQYQAAAPLLQQKLKQAIQEKLDYNKDIIGPQDQAQANYFAAPAKAREQYQNIWNPFEREALVAGATSNAYAPYATLTDILNTRKGNISDLVNAGTGAFQSAATAQQNTATQLRQAYQDALSVAGSNFEGAKWGYEQTHAKPSSAAAKSPFEDMMQNYLMQQIMGGGQTTNQSLQEPPMTSSPNAQLEYPPGSGTVWVSDGQGGWK